MPDENASERLRSAMLARLGLGKNTLPSGTEAQVDQLVSMLESHDVAIRIAAAGALGKLGERAPLEPLLDTLQDESDSVRAASVQALGMLKKRTPLEPLLDALHDPSWRVRAAAAHALGKLGERAPIEALAALINDEDESVCIAAVQALGEMGERIPIEPLVLALHDQDWSVREATVLVLEKIGGRKARDLLEEVLQDKDAMVRDAAERVLQRNAIQERPTLLLSQPTAVEPTVQRSQQHQRLAQWHISRRSFAKVAAVATAACIVGTSIALVPRFFSSPGLALQGIGGASFANSTTDIVSLQDGSSGVNDELLINLYSLQAPTTGKSYYGWLLANTADLKAPLIPLGRLPFQQGKISSLYKDPARQNLLLTSNCFLITEEDTQRTPLTPAADRTKWRYSAAISQKPDPSDTTHHYSFFEQIQHLLAKDPLLESIGLKGGVGFWLVRNVGKVGERAQNTQQLWKNHNIQQVRNQIIGMLDYLDGVPYVNKDLPPGTPLRAPRVDAQIGLLTADPQSLVSHAAMYLRAIAENPYASADQKSLATQLVAEVQKINAQCEFVYQNALMLTQMSDTQLLQAASFSLVNDMATHAAFALTGNMKAGMKGAIKVFDAIQSLASFDVEAYQS